MRSPTAHDFLAHVEHRNPGQPEFLQAVTEVADSLWPFVAAHPRYAEQGLLDRLVEPERVVMFRVSRVDDRGDVRTLTPLGRRSLLAVHQPIPPVLVHLSVCDPLVGHPVPLDVVFDEATVATHQRPARSRPTGQERCRQPVRIIVAGHGRSHGEVMRFCQALVTELCRHRGADTDVPAGDIGVGGREVGYTAGRVKKLSNRADRVFTGKGLSFGGSPMRPAATGYGTV
jgi:glutamate dehydrogenase (NADP+)